MFVYDINWTDLSPVCPVWPQGRIQNFVRKGGLIKDIQMWVLSNDSLIIYTWAWYAIFTRAVPQFEAGQCCNLWHCPSKFSVSTADILAILIDVLESRSWPPPPDTPYDPPDSPYDPLTHPMTPWPTLGSVHDAKWANFIGITEDNLIERS